MIGPVVSLPCRLASSANRQHPPPLTTSTSFSTSSTKPAIARPGLLTAIILHTPARLVSAGWLPTAGCCCCPSFRFVSLATYSLSDTNSRHSPSASGRACVSCTIPSCTVCLCVCVGHAAPEQGAIFAIHRCHRPIHSLPPTWSSPSPAQLRRPSARSLTATITTITRPPTPKHTNPRLRHHLSSRLARLSFFQSASPHSSARIVAPQDSSRQSVSADLSSIHVLLASSPVPCRLGHSFVPPTRNLSQRQLLGVFSLLLSLHVFSNSAIHVAYLQLALLPATLSPPLRTSLLIPAVSLPPAVSPPHTHTAPDVLLRPSWSLNSSTSSNPLPSLQSPTRPKASPPGSRARVRPCDMNSMCSNSQCVLALVVQVRSVC